MAEVPKGHPDDQTWPRTMVPVATAKRCRDLVFKPTHSKHQQLLSPEEKMTEVPRGQPEPAEVRPHKHRASLARVRVRVRFRGRDRAMVRVEDRARDRVRATGLEIGWGQGWGQGLGHRARDRVWSPHTLNPVVLYIPCSSIDGTCTHHLRALPSPPSQLGADARNILGIPAKGREAHPNLTGTLLAAVAAPAVRVFPGTASSPKTGRVLVLLAMLSTVSGWDSPLSPHGSAITGSVDGARDRRQLASGSLFAVITATKNAETLPYGPGPISAAAPYFCTDCIDTPSDSWTETVTCDMWT